MDDYDRLVKKIKDGVRDKNMRFDIDYLLDRPRTGLWNTELAKLARIGSTTHLRVIEAAIELMRLENIPLDWHTYAHLMRAQCKTRNVEAAEKTLLTMEAEGLWGNDVIYNTLIDGYMRMSSLKGITNVMVRMDRAGIEADRFTFVPLLRLTAEQGTPGDVERVRRETVRRNVFTEERSYEEVRLAMENLETRSKKFPRDKGRKAAPAPATRRAVAATPPAPPNVLVPAMHVPQPILDWCSRIMSKKTANDAIASLQRATDEGLGTSPLLYAAALSRVAADDVSDPTTRSAAALTAVFTMESAGCAPTEATLVLSAQVLLEVDISQKDMLLGKAREARLLPSSLARVYNVFVEHELRFGRVDEALELAREIQRNTATVELFAMYEPSVEPVFAHESDSDEPYYDEADDMPTLVVGME